MEELFRIENLSKSFGKKEVLKNINLKIFRGEIFAFMGPSGVGKTTLLRILNFLETPTSGRLIFNGNKYSVLKKNSIMRRMSMLFQRPAVFNTSVFNNVAYGLIIRDVDKKTIQKKVIDALNLVGLSGYEKQKALTLSGGESHRMAFARAIVYQPDILLLDEPTANLDPANVAKIEDIIKRIRSELGTTIIMASHNIYQVRRIADRVGILLNGELIEVNSKEQIFTYPKDARSYAFINGEFIY
jgi:tungstate transport system ATP-binding protein